MANPERERKEVRTGLPREPGRDSPESSFVITTELQTLPGCRIELGPKPREFCGANRTSGSHLIASTDQDQ